MRRCRQVSQFRRWPYAAGRRVYSEYAPAAPSPSDLKTPLPEKFSVGKNLKLKVQNGAGNHLHLWCIVSLDTTPLCCSPIVDG